MYKKLIFLLVIVMSINCYGQGTYYWSSGTKNYLIADSTTVLIKTTKQINRTLANEKFKPFISLGSSPTVIDSVHFVLKYQKTVILNDILKSFNATDLKINDLMYGYKYNQTPFLPTGVIVCKPKPGKTISDLLNLEGKNQILKNYEDEYKVVYIIPTNLKKLFLIANEIYESGLVEFCHPDFLLQPIKYSKVNKIITRPEAVKKSLFTNPNDTYYNFQYYLKNTGQTGGTPGVDINIENAWTIPIGNTTIRVALLDDGVENQEDMKGRVVAGYTRYDTTGYGAPIAAGNHGEAIAGIIAANSNNSIGIAGICQSAVIVPVNVKYYEIETASDYAASINWAWNGSKGNADVIASAVGFPVTGDVIANAITNARKLGRGGKGTTVIWAAGNNIPNNVPVVFPGNVTGVISVGGIDKNGVRWNYSPNSPTLVTPTGDASDIGDIYTIDRMGRAGYNSSNYMTNFGGTSAAMPQVAGVAALMLAVNPSLTEAQVRTGIINSAVPMYPTTSFGAGMLNAYAAIQSTFPPITGSHTFCSSSVYTISPVPPGSIVTWSISPVGIATLSPSGNQVTATKVTQGNAILTATVTGGTVGKLISTYNISTLPDVANISSVLSGGCNGGYQTWYLSATPNMAGATNWQWSVQQPASGIFNIYSPNSQSTFVSVKGGGTVLVNYRDACGETSKTEGTTIYSSCGRVSPIIAFPNPASNQLTIALNSSTYDNGDQVSIEKGITPTPSTFSVELFNDKGQILKTGKTSQEIHEVVLDITDLANGTYFLHSKIGASLIVQQIIIKH